MSDTQTFFNVEYGKIPEDRREFIKGITQVLVLSGQLSQLGVAHRDAHKDDATKFAGYSGYVCALAELNQIIMNDLKKMLSDLPGALTLREIGDTSPVKN